MVESGGEKDFFISDKKKVMRRDFPGGPMAKTPPPVQAFDPWLGNSIPHVANKSWCSQIKKKKVLRRNSEHHPCFCFSLSMWNGKLNA